MISFHRIVGAFIIVFLLGTVFSIGRAIIKDPEGTAFIGLLLPVILVLGGALLASSIMLIRHKSDATQTKEQAIKGQSRLRRVYIVIFLVVGYFLQSFLFIPFLGPLILIIGAVALVADVWLSMRKKSVGTMSEEQISSKHDVTKKVYKILLLFLVGSFLAWIALDFLF